MRLASKRLSGSQKHFARANAPGLISDKGMNLYMLRSMKLKKPLLRVQAYLIIRS